MSDAHRYNVSIFWSDNDEGFIAVVPELPGCSAFGETREQAAREIEDGIASWIEAMTAVGRPIPKPARSKLTHDLLWPEVAAAESVG